MTRYSRPADAFNPALDLAEYQGFKLDLNDGNGLTTYPRNWFKNATAQDLIDKGFTAYEPPPIPPTPITAEQIYLNLYQLRQMLDYFWGIDDTAIQNQISTIVNPDTKKRVTNYFKFQAEFDFNDSNIQWIKSKLQTSLNVTDAAFRSAWIKASNEDWS